MVGKELSMKKLQISQFKLTGLVLLGLLVTPLPVTAGDFDGSKPLLCAVTEALECGPDGECRRESAEEVNIPQFLRIDFKKKTISGTLESGEVRTAKIENMARSDGKLILQGVQNGKGWSMVITEATGKMTVTASDDRAGFVVFGACIAH
jgi:hypothetical protein